jgi:hypothetical protein
VLERGLLLLQDNVFWLGLLTHLQSDHVPFKRVECLRDLTACYQVMVIMVQGMCGGLDRVTHFSVNMYGVLPMQAATVDDLYDALAQFKLDDDNLFTVIGTSGTAPPPPPPPPRKGELLHVTLAICHHPMALNRMHQSRFGLLSDFPHCAVM